MPIRRLLSAWVKVRLFDLLVIKNSLLSLVGPSVVLTVVWLGPVTGAGGSLLTIQAPQGACCSSLDWCSLWLSILCFPAMLQTIAGLARSCTFRCRWPMNIVVIW